MSDDKKISLITPPGLLIISHIWEKDQYVDARGKKGTPEYRALLAYDRGDPDLLSEVWDAIYEAAVAEWGEAIEKELDDDRISVPIRDGDKMADGREQRGKKGDLTRGRDVLVASTQFNYAGDNDAGGIYVVDQKGDPIEWDRRREVYPGCVVRLSVTLQAGKVDSRYVKAYLDGLQLVEQGERIVGDKSGMFGAMMSEGSESKGRRGRGK